ncbi:MAG: insulinase family protein [Kofleriaceae bacterium]|nr:insulinase family protein [Kofleriaceae bacterium]
MKRALLSLFLVAACGPKPTPTPVPTLPGDGDANVAKPQVSKTPVVADAWSGRTDLIAPPAAKAPGAVELPAIEPFKLKNGLQVFVIKNDRLPVVSMQLAVRAGRMHEPRARLGVSEVTADMLVKGTKKRDALALAKAIDFVGGTIGANATYEATLLSCSVLARNQKTCLELLPEMITQPSFPEAELTKVREQQVAKVRQRLDDAGGLAAVHVQNLLWGNDHIRGWVDSEASIGSIKRDDLVAWHKAWFVPGNAMLVVTGDVDMKKIKGDLERSFGTWVKGPVPPAPTYKEPGLSGSKIRLVDKPGQTQTHIRVAQFGIKHDDPRFFDSLVWNYTLGGGAFSSRLMKVVRVEGGKTYGASSAFDRNLDKGSFVVSTFTRNAEAVNTTKLLLGEIAKMAKDGPTQDEVNAAVSNLAGGYGMRFQTASDVGAALLGAELHGFGKEYLSNYPLAVGKVDVASAKRAASEILDPKAYVIVMVGDAKDLEPLLKKEGWRYEKVAYTDPVSPEAPKVEVPVDAKALAAAQKVVDAALVAKGGKAKLTSMKGFKMLAEGETTMGPRTVKVQTERLFVMPDKMRIDATLVGLGNVVIGVDGKTGWQQAPNPQTGKPAVMEIGPGDFKQIEFERWREPELILLKAADPQWKARPDADITLNGKPHSVLIMKSPMSTVDVELAIDKATKLVTRTRYIDSASATTETDEFADYKAVNGIKIAHKRTSTATGAAARKTTLELKTVEIDPQVDPKVFAKPAAP